MALPKFPDVATVIAGPNTAGKGMKPVKNKNEVRNKQILKNFKITKLSYSIRRVATINKLSKISFNTNRIL